jgi:GNAT superfamily N-acetyltransferase
MISIDRLQAYFRQIARQQYESVSVPGYTLFFHPTDPLGYFNYAIPDEPTGGLSPGALATLRAEFSARGRCPRFEFIDEYAPGLAPALRAAGFCEETRQALMACTPGQFQPAPDVPGLAIDELSRASTMDDIRQFLTTQRRGFDPESAQAATGDEARHLRRTLGEGRAFVARLNGERVCAGMYTAPLDGIAEISGLATLEPYRRRGIATALAARAVASALANGVEVVCLSAADARAGRVYQRLGFVPCATMLAYVGTGI